MPDWLRSRIIRLLFHLVDPVRNAPVDGQAEKWLADNWGHPGFRSYIAQRDALLVRHIAGGDQLVAPEHRKVWQMSGQRVELLKMGHRAKMAFEKAQKEQHITRRSR